MTNLFRSVLVIGVLAAATLGACQATAPAVGGRVFLSVSITENGVPKQLVPGTTLRLDFSVLDTIKASVGCNTVSGNYQMAGDRLETNALATTDMGCDQPRMAQDEWLQRVLTAKPHLTLTADELEVRTDDVVVHLRDEKVVNPDRPIAGTTWVLDSITTGDVVSSIPGGVVATLVFHADGTLDVDDGCNTGGGSWKAVGAGIEISDLVLTKKACADAAGQVEAAVVQLLRAPSIAAAINGDRLLLQGGGGGLAFRAR
ncbi:MAG TPA: META domain-containing protein [Candidatus Limnocylindrales bacterium]|nr:META domain-containing protein [Candidatus Limnocylindrales bacterium]